MTYLRILMFRLRALFRARQLDRDIDDEISSHLAEATEEYAAGVRERAPAALAASVASAGTECIRIVDLMGVGTTA